MPAHLLSLTTSNKFSITSRSGDRVTDHEQLSDKGLVANLILSPDDIEPGIGFVRLRIEAQPDAIPSMTPEQTLDWLRELLKRML